VTPLPPDRQRLGLFEMKCHQCGAHFITQVLGLVQGALCQGCQQEASVRSLGGIHFSSPSPGATKADILPGADPPPEIEKRPSD
jgi:hypothetical protein